MDGVLTGNTLLRKDAYTNNTAKTKFKKKKTCNITKTRNDVCSTFRFWQSKLKNSQHHLIFTRVHQLRNWHTFPNTVRYTRCFTPTRNYPQYMYVYVVLSMPLNEVKRFNSVVLKRAKSQRCFGVVLMLMDLLC